MFSEIQKNYRFFTLMLYLYILFMSTYEINQKNCPIEKGEKVVLWKDRQIFLSIFVLFSKQRQIEYKIWLH